MAKRNLLAMAAAAGAAASAAVGQTEVVVPNNMAATAGTGGLNTIMRNAANPRSYQVIYAASQLTGAIGQNLTGITWRMSSGQATFPDAAGAAWTDYEIRVGTPATTVATMSTDFATNLGPNTVVVQDGPLTIPAGNFPGGLTLNPFGGIITFQTPFLYTGGDLIIDIRHPGGTHANALGFLDGLTTASTAQGYGTTVRAISQSTFTPTVGAAATGYISKLVFTPAGAVGACCLSDGSCVVATSTGCAALNGVYRGDNTPCATANCPQPATGACCVTAGCVVRTQAQCLAQGGTYRGDNTACATANCPEPCANVTAAIGGPSTGWPSTHGTQTGRLFRDGVPDTCTLAAQGGAAIAGAFGYDKYDFVNNSAAAACVRVDFNTACTGTNFIYAGAYIGGYNPANPDLNVVASLGGSPNPTATMSFNVPAGATFEIVVAEVTAGAGCPQYNFVVSGLANCGASQPCYANCDGSTTPPILNVNDFICFQTKYAAQDPTANCDGSTTPPVLNVNDFICFQTAYAAGCP